MSAYVQTNEKGDYALGADVDGEFVPFVILTGAVVAGRVERSRNLKAAVERGDEGAQAVAFTGSSPTKGSGKSTA